jgi:hypothetical protein
MLRLVFFVLCMLRRGCSLLRWATFAPLTVVVALVPVLASLARWAWPVLARLVKRQDSGTQEDDAWSLHSALRWRQMTADDFAKCDIRDIQTGAIATARAERAFRAALKKMDRWL